MGHAGQRGFVDIEHRVARAILRRGQHGLAATDYSARLNGPRQDDAIGIGLEIDIGQHFIGRCLLGLGGCQRTLGAIEGGLALFELGARGVAGGEQRVDAVEIALGPGELGPGRIDRGIGQRQARLLIGGVEAGPAIGPR
ncbi:hypothetical protein N8D56_09595 [Devosia sp. A8/3-2]|nr:hypothetical protein N8D56_09595 [Devosia sp. A8/3-2]